MKPIGRPPLPEHERASERVRVYLTPAERAELDAWADSLGRPLAALLREMALRAARRA